MTIKRLFFIAVGFLVVVSSFAAHAQTKPEKLRIGYAARAVAHSVPFVAKEAGFFAEEGIDAEVIRTAGQLRPWP